MELLRELFGMFKGEVSPKEPPLMTCLEWHEMEGVDEGASDSLPGERNSWGRRRMQPREEGEGRSEEGFNESKRERLLFGCTARAPDWIREEVVEQFFSLGAGKWAN